MCSVLEPQCLLRLLFCFHESENPILTPTGVLQWHCQILQLESGKACCASVPLKHVEVVVPAFLGRKLMLIGGWDGQCQRSARYCVAAGRIRFTTEPNSRVPVPESLIFRWSRCDCCAVRIGLRNNTQRNVVFLCRGLKGKL